MAAGARFQFFTIVVLLWMATLSWSLPGVGVGQKIQQRTPVPVFPETPESCPICARDYDSIQGCAEAAPVFQNFTNVIFNPGAFVDTIRCACVDTFRAVFPQCVDCFIQTGQEDVIVGHPGDLPAVVEGVRRVCALASTLLGNVTETNNDPANDQPPASHAIINSPSISLSIAMLFAGLLSLFLPLLSATA